MSALVLKIINVTTLLGLFFIIAYLNSVFQVLITKYVFRYKATNLSYSPFSKFSIISGILLPIITSITFLIPIGYNRNLQQSLLQESEAHPQKIFSLLFNILIHFILMFLLYKIILNSPITNVDNMGGCTSSFCLDETSYYLTNLLLVFIKINLIFIIMNIIPLFPGLMSYLFLNLLYVSITKKWGVEKSYRSVLLYQAISALILVFFFAAQTPVYYINAKVSAFISQFLLMDEIFYYLLILSISALIVIVSIYYRKKMGKYQNKIKKALHDILNKENEND